MSGPFVQITPPLLNVSDVGIDSCSAKRVNLSARPSPSVSSQIVMRSWPRSRCARLFG